MRWGLKMNSITIYSDGECLVFEIENDAASASFCFDPDVAEEMVARLAAALVALRAGEESP